MGFREGLRSVEKLVGIDRKTVRRYVESARELGLERDAGEAQLSDVLIALVLERSGRIASTGTRQPGASSSPMPRPSRVARRGRPDRRQGAHPAHPPRGLGPDEHPRALLRRAVRAQPGSLSTLRVADREPGQELEVESGRMGIFYDPLTDRRRVCQALIFTPSLGRYSFVRLTFSQTIESVIEAFEATWDFFVGVSRS
jgi:transposase